MNIQMIPPKNVKTLEDRKAEKILELKYFCTAAIEKGFVSSVNGYEFGFKEHDQANFNSQTNKLNVWMNQLNIGEMTQADFDAKFPLAWKAVNVGVVYLTRNEFLQVLDDAELHQRAQQGKYWDLEARVMSATTIPELDAITW